MKNLSGNSNDYNKAITEITYVQNKTLKQEIAETITDFANFFSEEKNVKHVKKVTNAIIEDLEMHARNIKKTKKHGIGHAMLNMMFPNTAGVKHGRKKSNKAK